MAFRFSHPMTWGETVFRRGLLSLLLLTAVLGLPVQAQTTNAPSVTPPASVADDQKFGSYMVAHQKDLEPFFSKHRDELIKQLLPLILSLIAYVILLNLVIGWVFDAGLALGFSYYFAPAYAGLKRALIYASVRLGVVVVVFGLGVVVLIGLSKVAAVAVFIGWVLIVLVDFITQAVLVSFIYKTRAAISSLFYVSLLVVHILVTLLLVVPMLDSRVKTMTTQFLDQNVTKQMIAATNEDKQDLKLAEAARDKANLDLTTAQSQLDQATTEQKRLSQEIEKRKNSEAFVYGRIVRLHAQGDLAGARTLLADFLKKFPSGSLKDSAAVQLALVESELATQEAQRKQAENDAAVAAAAARADLLARAAKGEVTLSEMRQVLYGKTRAEVTELLGKPSEIGPDRWGYSQRMITNNLAGGKYGLTVNFIAGTVQGVDYYYGAPR